MSFRAMILLLIVGCSVKKPNDHEEGNSRLQHVVQSSHWTYADEAIKVFEDGTIITGARSIEDHHVGHELTIDTIWTIYRCVANEQYDYEIGAFSSGNEDFGHILITTKDDNKRVLEFIAKYEGSGHETEAINNRRMQWVELCNLHNSADLVNELYSKHPIYYNHRKPINDADVLEREYAYMNNPDYSLSLEAEHVESISNRLAFEIGQCSGSYGGKYLLVWEKDESGKWRVLLDSNI